MVKERGPQYRTGTLVEWLKGWNDAAPANPDKGGDEQLSWQLAGQLFVIIVPRQRRSRNMQDFGKFVDNRFN
jgi:hypothetical protein